MDQFSKRLTFLKNTKPGTKLEVWHHPMCSEKYHLVITTKAGELRQDFSTETQAREMFERVSEEMAVG